MKRGRGDIETSVIEVIQSSFIVLLQAIALLLISDEIFVVKYSQLKFNWIGIGPLAEEESRAEVEDDGGDEEVDQEVVPVVLEREEEGHLCTHCLALLIIRPPPPLPYLLQLHNLPVQSELGWVCVAVNILLFSSFSTQLPRETSLLWTTLLVQCTVVLHFFENPNSQILIEAAVHVIRPLAAVLQRPLNFNGHFYHIPSAFFTGWKDLRALAVRGLGRRLRYRLRFHRQGRGRCQLNPQFDQHGDIDETEKQNQPQDPEPICEEDKNWCDDTSNERARTTCNVRYYRIYIFYSRPHVPLRRGRECPLQSVLVCSRWKWATIVTYPRRVMPNFTHNYGISTELQSFHLTAVAEEQNWLGRISKVKKIGFKLNLNDFQFAWGVERIPLEIFVITSREILKLLPSLSNIYPYKKETWCDITSCCSFLYQLYICYTRYTQIYGATPSFSSAEETSLLFVMEVQFESLGGEAVGQEVRQARLPHLHTGNRRLMFRLTLVVEYLDWVDLDFPPANAEESELSNTEYINNPT